MAPTRPICSIPDCGKPIKNYRGWCQGHYLRWHRHGDPLAGGTPQGAAQKFFNEVALTYEGDECLTWPFYRAPNGYGKMKRDRGSQIVSRVLCEEVNGPPPTPAHEAIHSCGKGHEGCVSKQHLSWGTPTDNRADMVRHGTRIRGEKCHWTKLTEQDVRAIRSLRGTASQLKIAARFGVSETAVRSIFSGRSWRWLT